MTTDQIDEQESVDQRVSPLKAIFLGGLAFAIHFFTAFVVCADLYWVAPRYKWAADVLTLEFPAITASAIRLSDLVVNYWYLCLLAVIIIDGPICLALRYLPDKLRWLRTGWLIFWPMLAIAVLFIEHAALSLMFMKLTSDLGR